MKETWELINSHIVIPEVDRWGYLFKRTRNYDDEKLYPGNEGLELKLQVRFFILREVAAFNEEEKK